MPRVLHVGCGQNTQADLPPPLNAPPWQEVRLDIDPTVEPDILASIGDMSQIADASFDALVSSHNLEHLYAHEVPIALAEFARVLSPTGFAIVQVPDLQRVAEAIVAGGVVEPAFVAPIGPVAPLDMLYGFRPAVAVGDYHMAHRTGFTLDTLRQSLVDAGFASISVRRDGFRWALCAVASMSVLDEGATALMAESLTGSPEVKAQG
jgi:hypothetical protein